MENPFDKKGKEEKKKEGIGLANKPDRKVEGPVIYADSQEAEPPSDEGSGQAQEAHKKLKKFSLAPEGIMKGIGRKRG